ncbi:MAG: 4-alpha-glucanotransferase [Negativicutes bacterium]|nr:4-alpha-glucanotransferase [Negativicutes bacterium]
MVKIIHNSHQPEFRLPFGAVPTGQTVRLTLAVADELAASGVWVNFWQQDGGGESRPLSVDPGGGDGYQRWTVTMPPLSEAGIYWYNFTVQTTSGPLYYGNNQRRLGGLGEIYQGDPPPYQLTVYDRDFVTPDWFRGTVVYQLMVDRFARDRSDSGPVRLRPGSLYHPDWHDTPAYLRDCGNNRVIAYDYFGGTLRGLINRLGYLRELNVGAIYLNPIFEAHSNHKYDTADYHKIDETLGSEEDFAELVTIARRMGIRLILDGVFNHTGADSIYFNARGRYPGLGAAQSPESPYYEWYNFSRFPDRYDCWWGNDNLPSVNEMSPSYRQFIIEGDDAVVRYWLKKGAGGWRLDVVDELPDQFLQDLRKAAKSVDPEALLLGEVWEDASNKVSYGVMKKYLLGGELDAVMNYPFRRAIIDFLLGKIPAGEVAALMMSLYENYPQQVFHSNLNLLGSHDRPRILSILSEVLDEDGEERPDSLADGQRIPPAARELGTKRLKLAALWQMTFPGAPCIYYGDEAGQDGGKDPCNRRTYPWQREDRDLVAYYKKLTAMRRKYPVLRTGDWHIIDAGHSDVLALRRYHPPGTDGRDDAAITIINSNPFREREVVINAGAAGGESWWNALDNHRPVVAEEGRICLKLPPLTGALLLRAVTRYSGVLLHPTSLPGSYGIGDIGGAARTFVDWLAEAGQSYWQILPHNPVGYGESPYQGTSAFAGNPMLISPDDLIVDGLLGKKEVSELKKGYKFSDSRVMYPAVKDLKEKILRMAFANFSRQGNTKIRAAFDHFCVAHEDWLSDYALFMALKKSFGGSAWTDWPPDIRDREQAAVDRYRRQLAVEVRYERFLQFIFFRQWQKLRGYANDKGIKIIGDLPLFVSPDSADVWANRQLFELNPDGTPRLIAGAPPDAFTADGQRWGNPQYSWPAVAADNYRWWRKRMQMLAAMVDVVRIDHFRGIEAYWEIDAREKTAVNGRWVKGPADDLLAAITEAVPGLSIIAENLGFITEEVTELKNRFGLPGMIVLQFEMEGGVDAVGTIGVNEVVYTGTHDNETLRAWFERHQRDNPQLIADICRRWDIESPVSAGQFAWRVVSEGMAADSDWFIVPMQDLLGLGADARMNRPGYMGGNWEWRCPKKHFSSELAARLKTISHQHGRNIQWQNGTEQK